MYHALAAYAQVLKDGDMVLAVAGRPVSSYDDVERLIAAYHPPPTPPGNEAAGVAAASAASAAAGAGSAGGAGANGVAAGDALQDDAAAVAAPEPSAKRQKTDNGGSWWPSAAGVRCRVVQGCPGVLQVLAQTPGIPLLTNRLHNFGGCEQGGSC